MDIAKAPPCPALPASPLVLIDLCFLQEISNFEANRAKASDDEAKVPPPMLPPCHHPATLTHSWPGHRAP